MICDDGCPHPGDDALIVPAQRVSIDMDERCLDAVTDTQLREPLAAVLTQTSGHDSSNDQAYDERKNRGCPDSPG